jgi:hypothetical protein
MTSDRELQIHLKFDAIINPVQNVTIFSEVVLIDAVSALSYEIVDPSWVFNKSYLT